MILRRLRRRRFPVSVEHPVPCGRAGEERELDVLAEYFCREIKWGFQAGEDVEVHL